MKGGKRPSAGRKAGGKNKLTIGRELQERGLVDTTGEMPVDVMLEVMRDKSNPVELRLDAAKAAAPYFHRKQPLDVKIDQTVHMPPPLILVHTAPPGDDELTH